MRRRQHRYVRVDRSAVIIVSSSTARNLEFYSAVDHTRLKKIENLLAKPHEIALDPTSRLAYITHTYRAGAYGEPNEKAHEISIVDVDRQEITGIINIASYKAPHDIEYDQLRDLLYVGVEDRDGRMGVETGEWADVSYARRASIATSCFNDCH